MVEATPQRSRSWSDIPMDIAGLVLRLLPAHADRARFAAVCPQWRAAARLCPLPTPLPLLALPDGTFYSLSYDEPFRFPGFGFADYKTTCGSWLVFPADDGCFLVDPFTGATVTLPALSSVRLRPPNAVAKYDLQGNSRAASPATWMHIHDSEKLHISKLILCSPNLVAAIVGIGHSSQILVCQPGALSWSGRAYDAIKEFEDMAFYQGKLYAIASDENLLVVNISQDQSTGNPQVSRIGRVIKGEPFCTYFVHEYLTVDIVPNKKLYLVESRGTLLMIRRKIWCLCKHAPLTEPEAPRHVVSGPNQFDVFKADFEQSQWVKVTTMGEEQVLFLWRRCSRAVSVSRYGMSGDQIFFLDDDEENAKQYEYNEEITSFSVYDMRDGKIYSPLPKASWKRCDEMRLVAWLFPQD
ncbi:hypothetical protein E2562_030738 [Oryza meyeriana var. granulata]|uniref:KIB1-4 beta-propeller domain-containing protein n=1 Tax=Oryza meyeriana var. granulata TaxID=110450 RepID=A0A6G1E5C5_9ORYZ|nr:hypothetical protein E2562_030738 [Oryza meyeriana var. granulata]